MSGVGNPSGTVILYEHFAERARGVIGADGTVAFTLPPMRLGTHRLRAAYLGDDLNATSESAAVEVEVRPEPIATQLTAAATQRCDRPMSVGTSMTLPPSLVGGIVTVDFTVNGQPVSGVRIDWPATDFTVLPNGSVVVSVSTSVVVPEGNYSVSGVVTARDGRASRTPTSSVSVTCGPPIAANDETIFLHADAAGSPVAATDWSGKVLWRENYSAFGVRANGQAAAERVRQFFHTKPADRSGLLYFGARVYDPQLGRFLSVDPVSWKEDNLHSFNRYAFANNNPYRFTDPDGRAVETVIDIVSLGLSVNEFRKDPSLINGIGVAFDAIATVVPFVPAGFGILKSASRAADALGDVGTAAKMAEASAGAANATTVIGRLKDIQKLGPGEKSLLDRLPDLGNRKANWQQNAAVLREEMRLGKPIRDASPGDTAGQYLNAERNLLRDRGWAFDPKTNYWMPPARP